MKHSNWTEADSRNAKRIWAEYQKQHDITERIGQTAGIDPKSERIWFGDSAIEIVEHRRAEGLTSPLFLSGWAIPPIFGKAGGGDSRNGVGYRGAAEVHWYEAHGIGRKKIKIKRFLD